MNTPPFKLLVVTPTWPPVLCGIADYTAKMTEHLAAFTSVTVLTDQGHAHQSVPGVTVHGTFRLFPLDDVCKIERGVEQHQPDWLLLQYNPFSFESRGLNFHLPLVMRRIRRRFPQMKIAVMVHEAAKPIEKSSHLISTLWVHWSLWVLGRSADVVLFTIDPWARRYRRWFPNAAVRHLPVGSNMPEVAMTAAEARERLNIAPNAVVIGLFSRINDPASLRMIREAVQAVRASGREPFLLYIGTQGKVAEDTFPDVPMKAEGPLPAEEVSRRFRAMDIYLLPYHDGISTRRTSFILGLQHGLPMVGTRGPWTDKMLLEQEGRAFLLVDRNQPGQFGAAVQKAVSDTALRASLGQGARQLYEETFTWERLSRRLLEVMTGPQANP